MTDFAYLMRHPDGRVTVAHDRHVMGLFSRTVWLRLIEEAGFRVKAVPQETATGAFDGLEIFIGIKPR